MRLIESLLTSRNAGAVLLLLAVGLASCHHGKRPSALTGAPGGASNRLPPPVAPPADAGPDVGRLANEGAVGSDVMPPADANTEGGPLLDIHFVFNSSSLTDEARQTLGQHANWLKAHAGARVTIEGHCDDRGTVEYNLALGEHRARAAKEYLVSLGVAAGRLHTVSFGKEKPLDTGTGEAAWAVNRRAHFVVAGA
jgi:peptidoglycan-associated lipoprotein